MVIFDRLCLRMKQQHPTMQETITTTAIRMPAMEIPAITPVERTTADVVPVCTCMNVCVHHIH